MTRPFRRASATPRLPPVNGKRNSGADQTIHILDVTPHEIVALKPAGLASELPRDPAADSFVRRLETQGFSGLRLVHRLDAASCGLMLVARSAEVGAHYSEEIAARRRHKWYVAQVALTIPKAEQLVGAHKPYLKVEGSCARVVHAGGKPSFPDVTRASPVPDVPDESHFLVQLHAGRFHQIRVMPAHRVAPISSDIRYGGPSGRTIYLDHAILAARTFQSLESRVWLAPCHPDRVRRAPALSDAVDAQVHTLSTLPAAVLQAK
jgi:23S rRNA-/tRNA-specific pseudouridylate synthase